MNTEISAQTLKLKNWKNTLNNLVETTGISLEEVCEYTGFTFNAAGPSFYVKLPRKRIVYIGVGMAFRQPLDVINGWIETYTDKRKLYVKDISEDLVWSYLINANAADPEGGKNYFRSYDEYQSAAFAIFSERWDEIILNLEETADVEVSLGQAEYGPEYKGLIDFVAGHMDAFKTAYHKPRKYLDMYVDSIITTCRKHPGQRAITSVNSMRGYLDDSMINFLCGDSETVNVIDRTTGKRSVNIKHIPKGRHKYICLCLALGMTADEISRYLELMGYMPLDAAGGDDAMLISALAEWEETHPCQKKFKNWYFSENGSAAISDREELQAIDEMLQLRSELKEIYEKRGVRFPYSN